MAQTKTKAKKRTAPKRAKSSPAKPAAKAKASTKAKARPKATKASKAKSVAAKAPISSNGASHSNGSSSKHSNVDAVKHAVAKAKVPLMAGGAALAGAAGGMALAATKKGHKSVLGKAVAHRPKIKLNSKDVAKAAKGVGTVSAQVSEIAGGLETAASGKDGRHRSPVEVVLQGLTARH
jgi:hypothetical protein